jgi:hypothetical protein
MKKTLFILSMILIIITLNQKSLAAPNPNPHPPGVEVGSFYSSLSPHGEWIELEAGFRVWRPLHMHPQWRPYLLGRWVWTDEYGWYWMSSEPFGWVTYHYGRWYNDDYYGWVWMPDDVWGPAWVEWRYDDDYIGWAPLPPYATFSISFGLRFTTHWSAPAHYWNFVRYNHFGNNIHHRDIAPMERTRRLIRTTRSGLSYEVNNNRIINRGIDRAIIERRGNVRISSAEIQEMHEQSGERMIRSNDNRRTERIEIYRPTRDQMQHGTERIEARRGDRALSIDMKKIERPHVESRTSSEERSYREPVRTEGEQPEHSIQREAKQQEQQRERKIQREKRPREYTPRVQEQKSQQDRKEMRRELIQRYERKQNPSPPKTREASQKRIERPSRNSSSAHPDRSASEKRSSRSGDKRRD